MYLARELPTEENPAVNQSCYALKKVCEFCVTHCYHSLFDFRHDSSWVQVLAGSNEQLTAAQKEISIMAKLHHPNLLPVLAHAVIQDRKDGRMLQLVYMLFPVYEARHLLCIAS